jgi:hypothetical protein
MINIESLIVYTELAIALALGLLIIGKFFWFVIGFKFNWESDLAARSLRHPMSMLKEASTVLSDILRDKRNQFDTNSKILEVGRSVKLHFGELRESRGRETGVLAVGLTGSSSIVRLRKGRKYA